MAEGGVIVVPRFSCSCKHYNVLAMGWVVELCVGLVVIAETKQRDGKGVGGEVVPRFRCSCKNYNALANGWGVELCVGLVVTFRRCFVC
jgi:hypothetical protein